MNSIAARSRKPDRVSPSDFAHRSNSLTARSGMVMLILPWWASMDVGGGTRIEESSELLGSPGMRTLVERMKTRYEDRYIFFDVPPVLAGADAICFAPLVDHILFIVQADESSMANVQKALGMLPKEKVLGIVLNRKVDADAIKYYY